MQGNTRLPTRPSLYALPTDSHGRGLTALPAIPALWTDAVSARQV